MYYKITENFENIIPTINIPTFPVIDNVNIDMCNQITIILNNVLIPFFNKIPVDIIKGLNITSNGIRTGTVAVAKGLDDTGSLGIKAVNDSIAVLNESMEGFVKIVSFMNSLFTVNNFFDLIITIISFILLAIVPSSQIQNISFYAGLIFYGIIVYYFVSPILIFVLLAINFFF